MRARKKLKPGQGAAKSLLGKFGERLVCAYYHFDDDREHLCKIIERIIETTPRDSQTHAIPDNAIIGLKICLPEVELQSNGRQAGSKWNREFQLLEFRNDSAVDLKLQFRIEALPLPGHGRNDRANSR
jgi:hypothetical protein